MGYFDLHDFKCVNDTWSHATGDELLLGIAQLLTRVIRTEDLAARLGGVDAEELLQRADEQMYALKQARRGSI